MSSSFLLSNNGNSNKGDKIKGKYQTLNINNLYKGKGLDAQRTGKSYGFQSLGKVTSSKKMPPPAILPSLRAENQGNDPNINLVSSGTSWASKERSENNENIASNENEPKSVETSVPLTVSNKTWNTVNSKPLDLNLKPVSYSTIPYGPTKFATNFQKEFPSLNSESKGSCSPALNLSSPFPLSNDLSATTFSVASSNDGLKETQSGEANASPNLNETSSMNYLGPQTTWNLSMKKNGTDNQTKKNGFFVIDDSNQTSETLKLGADNISDVKLPSNQTKTYGLIDRGEAYKQNYFKNEAAAPYYNYGYYYPAHHQSYPYHHPQYLRYPLPPTNGHYYAPMEPALKKEPFEDGYPNYALYCREKIDYPPRDISKMAYPINQNYRPLSYGHEAPYPIKNDVRQDGAKYRKGYSYEDDFYHSPYYRTGRAPTMPIRHEVEGKIPYNQKYAEDDSFINYESFSSKERWNDHTLEYSNQERLPYNNYPNQKSPRPYFTPPVPLLSLSLDPEAIRDEMGLDKRPLSGPISDDEKGRRAKWEEGASDLEYVYNYPKPHLRPASHDHVINNKYDHHFYSKELPKSFQAASHDKFDDELFAPQYITADLPVDREVQDEDMWNNLRAKQNQEINQALERARLKKGDHIDSTGTFNHETAGHGHRQNERQENVERRYSTTKYNVTKHGEVPTSPSYKANPQHRPSGTVNRFSNETSSQESDAKTARNQIAPSPSTCSTTVVRIRQRNSTGDTWDQRSNASSVIANTVSYKNNKPSQAQQQRECFKERAEDKSGSYRTNRVPINGDDSCPGHGKTSGSKQEENKETLQMSFKKGHHEPESRTKYNAARTEDYRADLPKKKLPEENNNRDYGKANSGRTYQSESRAMPNDKKSVKGFKDTHEPRSTTSKDAKETAVVPDKTSQSPAVVPPPKFKWVFEGGKIIKLPLGPEKDNASEVKHKSVGDGRDKSSPALPPKSTNPLAAPSKEQPCKTGVDKSCQHHSRVNDFPKSFKPSPPHTHYNQADDRKSGHQYTRHQHTFEPYPPSSRERSNNVKEAPPAHKITLDAPDHRARLGAPSSAPSHTTSSINNNRSDHHPTTSKTLQNGRREGNVSTTAPNTRNHDYRGGRPQDADKSDRGERAYRPAPAGPRPNNNATSWNNKSSFGKPPASNSVSSYANDGENGKKVVGHGFSGQRESPRSSIPSPALPGPRGSSVRSPSGWEDLEEWETASESSERCAQINSGGGGKWADDHSTKAPPSPRNEVKHNGTGGGNSSHISFCNNSNPNAGKRYPVREAQPCRPKVGFGPGKYGNDNFNDTCGNSRAGVGGKSGSHASFAGETRTVNAGFGRGAKLSRNPGLPNGGPLSRYDINDIASVVVIDDHPDARHSTKPNNAHPATARGTDDDFQEVLNRKALRNRNKTTTTTALSSQHHNAARDKSANLSPQPFDSEIGHETRSVIDTMSEIGTWDDESRHLFKRDEASPKGDESVKSDQSGKKSSSPLDPYPHVSNTRVLKNHGVFPQTSQMVPSNNDKESTTTFGSPTAFASSGMTSSDQNTQSHMKVRIPASPPPPSSTSSSRHHHHHPSTPISPSAADLNLRIASVKKVWDSAGDSQRDAWRSSSTEDFAITNLTCKSPGGAFKKADPSQLPPSTGVRDMAKLALPNAATAVVSSNVCKVKPHKQQSVTTSSSTTLQHQSDYQQRMVSLMETPAQQSLLFDSPNLAAQFQSGSFLRTNNNPMAMYENFLAGTGRGNSFVAPPLDLSQQLQPSTHNSLGDNGGGDSINAVSLPVQNNNPLYVANYGVAPSQVPNASANSALEVSINNSAGLLGFGPNFGQNYQNLLHSGNPASNLTYNNHLGNNQPIPIGTFQPSTLVPTSLPAHNLQAGYHQTSTNVAVGHQTAHQSLDLAIAKPFGANHQSQLHQGPRNPNNNNLATAPPMLLQLDPLNNFVDMASLTQHYQGPASSIAPRLPYHGHQERPNNLYNYFPTPPAAPTSNLPAVAQPPARLTVNDYAAAYLNQQQQNLAAALIGNSAAQAQHQQHQNAVAAALQSIYSGDRAASFVPNIGDPSSPTPQESLLYNMIVGMNQGQGVGANNAAAAASMYLGGVLQRQHPPPNNSHQQQQLAQQTQSGNERGIANAPPPFVTMSLSDYYLADPSAVAKPPQPNPNSNHGRAGFAPPNAQMNRGKYGHNDNKGNSGQVVAHALQSNSVPNFMRKASEASWTTTTARQVGNGYDGDKRKQTAPHKIADATVPLTYRTAKKVDKSHSLSAFERNDSLKGPNNNHNSADRKVTKDSDRDGHACDDIDISDGGKKAGSLSPVDPQHYSQLQAALVDSIFSSSSSHDVKRDDVRDNVVEAPSSPPFPPHRPDSDLDTLAAATGDAALSLKTNDGGAHSGGGLGGIGAGVCSKEEAQSLDAFKQN